MLMRNIPPPPPHRSLLIDSSKAEEKRSRVRSRPFYARMCEAAKPSDWTTVSASLPDELLMEILLRLPAHDIYDNARLVCRRWRHLIHSDAFVYDHLHLASSGLLLKPRFVTAAGTSPMLVTATMQGRVETSKLRCKINFPIVCSCNGLALCFREVKRGRGTPFIFNPATMCAFSLPRFPVLVIGYELVETMGMAYAAASMAYKVFGSYDKLGRAHFVMLTVGVDRTWRRIAHEGLSPQARWMIMRLAPLNIGGFVHWVWGSHGMTLNAVTDICLVSLNVETENFTETRNHVRVLFPDHYKETRHRYCPLSTGEYLSLFVSCGDWSWDVWEMKPETREWRKLLLNLDLEAHKCKVQHFASNKSDVLKPVGWVRYPEVLAFSFLVISRYCIIYNLDKEEFEPIELSFEHRSVVQHRNTLVWSERC